MNTVRPASWLSLRAPFASLLSLGNRRVPDSNGAILGVLRLTVDLATSLPC
jgi:hypothetical protein